MTADTQKIQSPFLQGFKDGIPIGLGYFAVAFSLGITAGSIGITALQGFFMSLTTLASSGEYAGVSVMAEDSGLFEMFLLTVVTDARYILMSCAMSQRIGEKLPLIHRMGLGMFLTDELFAITIARPGEVKPSYTYGAGAFAAPMWALGTSLGIIVGNIVPARIVTALSVSIYGMFIAAFVPPAKENRSVALCVAASFLLSFAASRVQPFAGLSSGTRCIILIIVISAAAAVFLPVKDVPGENGKKEAAETV